MTSSSVRAAWLLATLAAAIPAAPVRGDETAAVEVAPEQPEPAAPALEVPSVEVAPALPAPVVAAPAPATDRKTVIDGPWLHAVPRPNDAWSVARDAPGILLDRVAVGPSDTASQALLVSHGDPGSGAVWILDGVDVTDPAATGTSMVYAGLDAVGAVEVATGALDVRTRTPGVQVTITSPDPAPGRSGGLHLRGAADALQADNKPAQLGDRPFFRARTQQALSIGGDAATSAWSGRLWLRGAASLDRLRQETATEHVEALRATMASGRALLHHDGGTSRLLLVRSGKVHDDRDVSASSAPEARWRQSGPTNVVALQHRRPVRGAELRAQASLVSGGFQLDPQGGTSASAFEDGSGVLRRSYYSFDTNRRRVSLSAELSGSAGRLGAAHSWLAGASFRRARTETQLDWPGNGVLGLERQSVFFRTFQLTGFALPSRSQSVATRQDEWSLFLQDTARRGRLEAALGARLDVLTGRTLPSRAAANPEFPELLPALQFAGTDRSVSWRDLLPRAAVTWDVTRDGRTRASLAYAAYAGPLSGADVGFDAPLATSASVTYYWRDLNGDDTVQVGELDTLRGRLGASGLDPERPDAADGPHRIAGDLRASRTRELSAGLERQMGQTRASVRSSWRRRTGVPWTPLRGLTAADYALRGIVNDRFTGGDYQVGYYAPASESRIVPGNGRVLDNRDGYRQDAVVIEGALSRAGRRVRWSVWGAWMDWREWFDDRALAVQDPTPLDSGPLRSGGAVTVRPGGLGRGDVFVSARWQAGALLSARLPWSLAAGARIHAREGYPLPRFQAPNTGDATTGVKNVLVSRTVDEARLPALLLLDLRLERTFAAGPGRLVAGVDAFNALNRGTTLQRSRDVELDAPALERPREVLRPLILQLGLQYRF